MKILFPLWLLSISATAMCQDFHAVEDFLDKYCLDCHDSSLQKGDRSFEALLFPLQDYHALIEAQDIVDQLNLGVMPPKDADQPTEDERAQAVAHITKEIARATEKIQDTGRQTTLRRLNEREYLNTLRDLFSRRVDTLGLAATFPNDQTYHHLDTIGSELVTSSFLLQNHFEAADRIVEKSLNPRQQPKIKEWRFAGDFDQGQELSYAHKHVYQYRYLCVYEVPNTVNHEGGYAGLEAFSEGVHAHGEYEVKVLAHAMHRDTPYDPAIFQMDFDEPFRLGIVSGDARVGKLHHPQPIEPHLAEVTVADGEPQWYTMRVWLERGQQPRFIFPNGMANCRTAFSKISRTYQNDWPADDPFHKNPGIAQARRAVLKHGKMPHIRIHEVKVRGPLYDSWPPAGQKAILGKANLTIAETRERIIRRFADRAYRRPATDQEVTTLVNVADARIAAGHSPRQATLDAFKAALCSPAFLYLSEPKPKQNRHLSAYDLAARLSYFLTASLPDEPLVAAAADSSLLKPDTLLQHATRLLQSEHSDGFYTGFTDSWLNLRELGGMPPDRLESAVYYHDDLETAMQQEVTHYLRHLVEENRPTRELIKSNYTFINHPLAKLYKLDFPYPVEQRYQFQKVSFKTPRRGGLLGMAAVHTISANGIETSPVTRGVFILENLLGTPTPPPPDEVPAIEPDLRGATTIRDLLAKHREVKTCAECHRKIDPLGFGLENFDPIGRWRDSYKVGRKKWIPIEKTGQFADGTAYQSFHQFKNHLATQQDFITRHLAETLLAYGTGRKMTRLDRVEIEALLDQIKTAEGDYPMKDLLNQIILSDIFRSP